jgi:hypothetical protein
MPGDFMGYLLEAAAAGPVLAGRQETMLLSVSRIFNKYNINRCGNLLTFTNVPIQFVGENLFRQSKAAA